MKRQHVAVLLTVISLILNWSSSSYADVVEQRLRDVGRAVRRGEETDTASAEQQYLQLLDEFEAPEDVGKIYAEISRMYCDAGLVDNANADGAVNYGEKALEYPLEPYKEMHVYIHIGDALNVRDGGASGDEFARARRDIVRPYLEAFRIALDNDVPEERVPLPVMGAYEGFVVGDSPESQRLRREQQEREEQHLAAREEAKRINRMFPLRHASEGHVVYLYSREPLATDELRRIAIEMLEDQAAVDSVIAKVESNIAENLKREAEKMPGSPVSKTGKPDGTEKAHCNHFLFVRYNPEEKTRTLVLAEVREDGFELRDVFTTDESINIPRCVAGGTAYLLRAIPYSIDLAIDLATGERRTTPRLAGISPLVKGKKGYSLARQDLGLTLRVYDFAKAAYRDLEVSPGHREPVRDRDPERVAISADHRRLAYFERYSGRASGTAFGGAFVLCIVDVEAKTVNHVGPIIGYIGWNPSNPEPWPPPLIWLDSEKVLFVRDVKTDKLTRWMSTIDVLTGEMRDVMKMPGESILGAVSLYAPDGASPAYMHMALYGRYRIDVEGGKLIEDDTIGGDFSFYRGEDGTEVRHGDEIIDRVVRHDPTTGTGHRIINVTISPDGQRALWVIDHQSAPRELKYYDADEGTVRAVTEGPFEWSGMGQSQTWVQWIAKDDLVPPPETPEIPTGWTPFDIAEKASTAEANKERVEPRKKIHDFLKFTMTSDKERYRLHEPVELTLSLMNISDTDVEVVRPYPDDRVVSAVLNWTQGGSGRFFRETITREQTQERVVLKAGDIISETGTFDFSTPSSYRISGRYDLNDHTFQGSIEAAVEFSIEPSPNNDTLLKAKLDRLVTRLREECANEMTWNGSNGPTSPQMEAITEALRDVGPSAKPYLIAAIRAERDERVLLKLYRPLIYPQSPEALPLYEERLGNGTTAEKILICDGLRELRWHESLGDKALGLLISALEQQDPSVRREAAKQLRHEQHASITAAFEKALRDSDLQVREKAAWYLAKAEKVGLAEWLNRAAEEPTRARYMAAHLIISRLEKNWDEQKGRMPSDDWDMAARNPAVLEQFRETMRAWAEWAQENPRFSSNFF